MIEYIPDIIKIKCPGIDGCYIKHNGYNYGPKIYADVSPAQHAERVLNETRAAHWDIRAIQAYIDSYIADGQEETKLNDCGRDLDLT